jgi:hypothetical protein
MVADGLGNMPARTFVQMTTVHAVTTPEQFDGGIVPSARAIGHLRP